MSIPTRLILPDESQVGITLNNDQLSVTFGDAFTVFYIPSGRTKHRAIMGTVAPALNTSLPVLSLGTSNSDSVSKYQLWVAIYALWLRFSDEENLFITIPQASVPNSTQLRDYLLVTGLGFMRSDLYDSDFEVALSRYGFWQGAGIPSSELTWNRAVPYPTNVYPFVPDLTINSKVATTHPHRPPKPQPGSLIYTRYIPTVDEVLTFIALDPSNPTHFEAFHRWQNDPRVSEGWNEDGDEAHHRKYLNNVLEDPHVFSVLGAWNGELFGYFELTWTKEDHISPHANMLGNEWDRGYHVLVGEARFRGLHRYIPWTSSLDHYLFLSDARTQKITLEPKAGNKLVVNDVGHRGHSVEKEFDFPHKRSSLLTITRERFFQQTLM